METLIQITGVQYACQGADIPAVMAAMQQNYQTLYRRNVVLIKEWQTGWQRSYFASTLLRIDRRGLEKMVKGFGLSLMRNLRIHGKVLLSGMKGTEQLTVPMKQI